MKHFLLIIILACMGYLAYSQPDYPYQDIKLEKPRDYIETEPIALSAANLLLTTPFSEVDAKRGAALAFLSSWITGTKQYHFYMEGIATQVSEDKDLLTLFIAAMAKYSIEHKNAPPLPLELELAAAKVVVAYCDDPRHNFKLKKKYRKILEKN